MMNEVRIGLNRQTTALTQEDYGQNLSTQFGIPGVNMSPQTSGLSSLVVNGLFNIGDSLLTPLQIATTDWNFTDKITWVKGRHVIRLGFDYQHEMGSTGYLVYGRGNYTFLNLSTSSLIGTPGGNAFASFLVGAPYRNSAGRVSAGHGGADLLSHGFLCAGRHQGHAEAHAQRRRALRHHAVSARNAQSAVQLRSGDRNDADRRSRYQSAAGEYRLQRSRAASWAGLLAQRTRP